MAVLFYSLCGFLLLQGIHGGNTRQEASYNYAIPAIPALSINPEEYTTEDHDSEDFAIPATPAIKVTPEEEEILLKHFQQLGMSKENGFSIPAVPAMTAEELFNAYSIPAIPALSVHPDTLLKDEVLGTNEPFVIPAIPAIRLNPEEKYADSIPAIPAMSVFQFADESRKPAPLGADEPFSIPAIPALRINPEENYVYSIPAIPAMSVFQSADESGKPAPFGANEPFSIPATPALSINPEENVESHRYMFADDSVFSIPAIPALSYDPYQGMPFSIPAIPAIAIDQDAGEQEGSGKLSSNMTRCMNMILSIQKIPRLVGNLIDAGAGATQNGLPLLKKILECSEGGFMETFTCLSSMEAEIKQFVIQFDSVMQPPFLALVEQVIATKQELDGCLEISHNTTQTNYDSHFYN